MSPDRQLSAPARTAQTTISLSDALRTTCSTAGGPRRTDIGSSCVPSHHDSRATSPRSSSLSISTDPAGWTTAARPGKADPSAHSMKKGSDGSAAGSSRDAARQRNTWPSGVTLDPLSTIKPSLCAIRSRSVVRTAQPNGLLPDSASTAATQRPKSLSAASSRSTTATSSR